MSTIGTLGLIGEAVNSTDTGTKVGCAVGATLTGLYTLVAGYYTIEGIVTNYKKSAKAKKSITELSEYARESEKFYEIAVDKYPDLAKY